MPTFDELLQEVQRVLERDGRTSYRALKRRFELDDEYLEDLKEELIHARGVARDEEGRVLVWSPATAAGPARASLQPPSFEHSEPELAALSGMTFSLPAPSAALSSQHPEPRVSLLPQAERRQAPAPTPTPMGERRQLTVMFCDLVSSTELASRLDPEEYGEILAGYHAKCAEAILRYGGHIAQYLGDGVHAYFGYPHAHEDAATRAVHAGLAILDQLRRATHASTRLAVRIGIHTGTVVMNDVGDAQHIERMAMGDVPNVAARVQSVASVNSIAVTPVTRTLLRDEFLVEPLGTHTLKGVPKPLPLFRVIGTSSTSGEVTASEAQPPLFGRDAELQLLHSRFLEAQKGAGQIVAICGEPGIGKSRLLRAFRASLHEHPHTYWEVRCSPYHTGTALYPLIELIRRHFFLREGEPERSSLEKLRRGFANAGHASSALPLLASLLSIGPLPPEVASLTRVQQRRKLIEMFVAFFLERAQREPVVIALDDLHWADPSTIEFLSVLTEQVPATQVLLLTGFRPSADVQWQVRDRITMITLDRLSQAEASELIARVARGKRLPPRLHAELLERTDGVPLFIEESTRMLLDSPGIVEHEDHYELLSMERELGVPCSIQDSLMARLDQLTSAKEVAQLAAIIGRTFHYELIAALWATEDRLRIELSRLVQAGLLLQRGLPPEAVFSFKHVLIQDVSYASTLKRVRRSTHSEVAKLLVSKFPQIAAAEPELIAHHFSEAGLAPEAVHHWQRAADKALSAFANVEAVRHLQRALTLVPALPMGAARDDLELSLLTTLGPPLVATQGYSAPEVKRTYERAFQLCQALDDAPRKWSVLFGTFLYHSVRGDGIAGRTVGRELTRLARRTGDPDMRLELCIVQGHELWYGQLALARSAFESTIELYDTLRHAGHAAQYGQDPFVFSHAYLAGITALQGEHEAAREHTRKAVAHARRIEHPHSLGLALGFASMQCQLLGDYAGARTYAAETREIAVQHCLATWLAEADIMHGWAEVMLEGTSDGLLQLQAGLRAWELLGAKLWRTHQLALLAEAQLRLGQPKRALEALTQAELQMDSNGERYYQAEILRLQAEARLQLEPGAVATAEAAVSFRRALHVAREQGARLFEGRAREALERIDALRLSDAPPELAPQSRSDAN